MEVLSGFVDIQVVAFCLLFGNVLKNTKLNNNLIPILLLFIGAIISMLLKGLSSEAALVGIYSAWISTGIHSTQSGVKKLYKEEK